jgi:hypothetical protein
VYAFPDPLSEARSVRIPKHPTLIRRMLASRLKKATPKRPVLAASFVEFHHRCSWAACVCHAGGPKHLSQHLTFKEPSRKTRSVYVPKDLVKDVRSWIEEHRRLKRLLQEIHQLTLALVRTHVQHRRRQKGRV